MSCKLHIPYLYNPRTRTWSCKCGAVKETDADRANRGQVMAPKQKPGRSKQDYGTPDNFLAAVRRRLQITEFYRDLAASQANAVCLSYYSEQDNSLVQPWGAVDEGKGMWVEGEWNWLNPPFSHIAPWVRRAYETSRPSVETMTRYAAQTAVLVPAGVGANWWRDWVHDKARVLLLNGRLTFKGTPSNPKTGKPDAYPKDCALLLYGPTQTPGYEIWAWQEAVPAQEAA